MRRTSLAIAISILLALVACKQQSNAAATSAQSTAPASVAQSTNLTPEELGELGAKIKKNPKDAERLLSERGLTEASFEQAVRKVAESPEQSKRYAAAYKKAS